MCSMLNNETFIFIGTIKKVANCGESMKNHLFIDRFREVYHKVIQIDVFQPRKHPLCILKIIIMVLLHPKSRVALSVSIDTGDKIMRLLQRIGCKRVYYWAVGGTLHKKFSTGKYDLEKYKQAKAIYVQSESMVNGLRELGFSNVFHVDNSKRIDYLPDIVKRKNQLVRFVFLSRLHPDKGCGLIVNSVRRLNELGYRGQFVVDFYGKIDEKYSQFMTMINGVDNLSYRGFLDLTGKTGYDTLSTYDMMLFPTYWDGEGFPGVIIDAYISGVPVIASNWSCNEEVVDSEIGIIIPHHDENALLMAMRDVIDGKYNLEEMAVNCQKRAMSYDNRKVLSVENLRKIGMID